MSDAYPHHRPNVGVVLFNAAGKVWLGKRYGADEPWCWQFPQGGMDEGETPEEAGLRELYEETGVTARITGLIDVVDSIMDDAHYVLIDFEAEWISGEPVAADDAEEAAFFPHAEALEKVSWDETRRVITPRAPASPHSRD